MADETTDITDRAQLSIFIRYIDADDHTVKEEYLGLTEVVEVKVPRPYWKRFAISLRKKELISTR